MIFLMVILDYIASNTLSSVISRTYNDLVAKKEPLSKQKVP